MKRTAMLVTFLTAAALLTACGSATGSRTSFIITPTSKLALGTLKLEGTPQAVDKATATKLLPLWQLLQQLSTGTSTAPQEITAVLDQIQATMTPEQSQAINGMQITQADFAAAFQQARSSTSGGAAGGAGGSGTAGSNRGGGSGGGFPGGGFPGGGFPGGGFAGGGFPGGGTRTSTGTPSASTGATSSGSGQSSTNRGATFVVGVVVRLLESKIGT